MAEKEHRNISRPVIPKSLRWRVQIKQKREYDLIFNMQRPFGGLPEAVRCALRSPGWFPYPDRFINTDKVYASKRSGANQSKSGFLASLNFPTCPTRKTPTRVKNRFGPAPTPRKIPACFRRAHKLTTRGPLACRKRFSKIFVMPVRSRPPHGNRVGPNNDNPPAPSCLRTKIKRARHYCWVIGVSAARCP